MVGLANIYVPSNAKERVTFFELVVWLLEPHWLIFGDFDMVETEYDKEGMLHVKIL